MAAFQAKTDYGFDLGDQLAEKAVGQLQYEIDTEVVQLLDETAGTARTELAWSKQLPVGVNKRDHYFGFVEVIEIARQLIYDATKRFAPNYMVVASNIIPILTFIDGWNAAPTGSINGPYFAGTLNGLKVYVSPALKANRYLFLRSIRKLTLRFSGLPFATIVTSLSPALYRAAISVFVLFSTISPTASP